MLKDTYIFIYQNIKKNHGIYTTDEYEKNNIFNYLPKNSIKISFPYIYDNSFYPFKGPIVLEQKHLIKDIEVIYDNSLPIINKFKLNKSLDEVIHLYKNNEIDFNFKDRNEKTLKILQENENKCDITISDYLIENINRRLFLVENHPITEVFVHIVNKILKKINCQEINYQTDNILDNFSELPGFIPISTYEYNNKNYKYDYQINDDYFINLIKNVKKMYDHKMIK